MANHIVLGEKDKVKVILRTGSIDGAPCDPIASHNEIANNHGQSKFGWVGRPFSASAFDLILKALRHQPEFVLVRRSGESWDVFSATLKDMELSPCQIDSRLVPRYYHHLIRDVRIWFTIGLFKRDSTPINKLRSIALTSNGRCLLDVLQSCRTSLMVAEQLN